jgi:hypothetical protein
MNRRNEERFSLLSLAKVTLLDHPDQERDYLLSEVSETGLKLVGPEQLPVGEHIGVELENHLLLAQVRYSYLRGANAVTGAMNLRVAPKDTLQSVSGRAEKYARLEEEFQANGVAVAEQDLSILFPALAHVEEPAQPTNSGINPADLLAPLYEAHRQQMAIGDPLEMTAAEATEPVALAVPEAVSVHEGIAQALQNLVVESLELKTPTADPPVTEKIPVEVEIPVAEIAAPEPVEAPVVEVRQPQVDVVSKTVAAPLAEVEVVPAQTDEVKAQPELVEEKLEAAETTPEAVDTKPELVIVPSELAEEEKLVEDKVDEKNGALDSPHQFLAPEIPKISTASIAEAPPSPAELPIEEAKQKGGFLRVLLPIAAGALIGFAVLYFVQIKRETSTISAFSEPVVHETAPPESIAAPVASAEPSATNSGSEAAATATPNPAPVAPVVSKETTKPPAVSAAAASAAAAQPESITVPHSSGAPHKVALRVSADNWVSACTDGKPVFVKLLSPGAERIFDFSERTVLRTGNAGSAYIEVDGRYVGKVGPSGGVRLIELTTAGFRLLNSRTHLNDCDVR